MPAMPAPQKITFAVMRATGVSGVLVYCSDGSGGGLSHIAMAAAVAH
jgi:hypothetical protein